MNEDNLSYLKSLLKNIGYLNDESVSDYISNLETLYAGWDDPVSICIGALRNEIELKMLNNTQPKEIDFSKKITATDLSQYTFCPVSYSIAKSLKVDTPQSASIGTSLHKLGLLARTTSFTNEIIEGNDYESDKYNLFEDTVIKKIINSILIFSGHADENYKSFENSNENYSGCPDYIFKDGDGKYFVVEEKFHKSKDAKEQKYFNLNHELQIVSYIRNIQEYPIDYGYLVYWYYDKDENGNRYLSNVISKEMRLNEDNEILYSAVKTSIEELLTNRVIDFATSKLKQSKCVRCSVSKYCRHKNGRYNELTIPYSQKYIGLFLTGKTKFDYPVYVYAIVDFTNGDKTIRYLSAINEFPYWDNETINQWLNKIVTRVKEKASDWINHSSRRGTNQGANQKITVTKRETKQYYSRYRASECLDNEQSCENGSVRVSVHGEEIRISQ